MVRLLHLSDIHFSKLANTAYDLDQHVRDLLVADLKSQLNNGHFTGCLITGDIAFSGQEIEYKTASDFLDSLSTILGFPIGSIWVVPGNHDSDRSVSKNNLLLQDVIKKFRFELPVNQINDKIRAYSSSPEHKDTLLSPLKEYNNFAKKFNCEITLEKFYWDNSITLSESPEVQLHLRGLSSIFISSPEDGDKDENRKLIMSLKQCQHVKADNIISMSLCHHPTSWLRNQRELQTQLCHSFHIQLFGHEHESRVDEINDSIIVHAGAIHPEKNEGAAVPTYNILEFNVVEEEKHISVELKVISRSYSFEDGRFKNIEPKKEKYPIRFPKTQKEKTKQSLNTDNQETTQPQPEKLEDQIALRTLLRKFYDLNSVQQFQTLNELGLIRASDSEALDKKNYMPFFFRAKDENLLGKMQEHIEAKLPTNQKNN